jgi:putative membrane protein
MMMWYGSNGWGWLHWTAMTVGMVAFWALVITAVVLAVHYLTSQNGASANAPITGQTHPADLLAQRFARGEIDDNEYRNRLALLQEQR